MYNLTIFVCKKSIRIGLELRNLDENRINWQDPFYTSQHVFDPVTPFFDHLFILGQLFFVRFRFVVGNLPGLINNFVEEGVESQLNNHKYPDFTWEAYFEMEWRKRNQLIDTCVAHFVHKINNAGIDWLQFKLLSSLRIGPILESSRLVCERTRIEPLFEVFNFAKSLHRDHEKSLAVSMTNNPQDLSPPIFNFFGVRQSGQGYVLWTALPIIKLRLLISPEIMKGRLAILLSAPRVGRLLFRSRWS